MHFENLEENLTLMGVGMLGVFMIIGVIVVATYLTGYLTNKFSKPNKY